MKLDVNEIYHQYIIRIVIFALFLYKRQIKQTNVFKHSILAFVKRRLPWKIDLIIDTGVKLPKEEEREIVLNQLFHNQKSDYLRFVTVTFITPLKTVVLEIDLHDESKYEKFLYS